MTKLTRRTIVLAALCAGLLAALLAYLFLDRERVQAAKMTEPVQVVVATQDIPARTVVAPGMVRDAMRPIATVPPNTAASVREVVGRVTVAAVTAEEPIQRSAIALRTASLGMAYVVPEGMRAVAVALDPIIGVAGFLKAGDHVDVLATFEVEKVSVTKTVLQDVELLAIGPDVLPEEVNKPRSNNDARPKQQPNATLSLNPGDAEKLILAEAKGKLRLTLRPMGDAARVALSGVRSDALIGVQPASSRGSYAARPAAAIMSTGYPLLSPPPRLGSSLFRGDIGDSGPQPVTFGNRVKISRQTLEPPVSVETVRGTKSETVEVQPN
jgi:pilus assembly protein CpaB